LRSQFFDDDTEKAAGKGQLLEARLIDPFLATAIGRQIFCDFFPKLSRSKSKIAPDVRPDRDRVRQIQGQMIPIVNLSIVFLTRQYQNQRSVKIILDS